MIRTLAAISSWARGIHLQRSRRTTFELLCQLVGNVLKSVGRWTAQVGQLPVSFQQVLAELATFQIRDGGRQRRTNRFGIFVDKSQQPIQPQAMQQLLSLLLTRKYRKRPRT